MRRQQLTEAQIAALFDPSTDRRELLRHWTVSEADLSTIGGKPREPATWPKA
jgi:hypothetical protein